jgi:hypothetical protein
MPHLPMDVYYRVVNISESYYILLNRLKKMENSVLNNTARKDGQPRGNQVSDTTAQKAEKIIGKQEECERKIKAIEKAMEPLGPLYKDLIRLYFFEHKDMRASDLPISHQEKKDVLAYFLTKLAQNLNEI